MSAVQLIGPNARIWIPPDNADHHVTSTRRAHGRSLYLVVERSVMR